jgi:phosphohistidine phosphatase
MRLYIVRHAIALPQSAPGIQDEDRTLTEKGVKKMRLAAAGLRSLGYIPELLLSSPLIRAVQTAEILLQTFGEEVEMKISATLAPSGNRRDLHAEIARYERKLDSLMIVGHQPSLGELAGEIVCGSPGYWLDLKKGGACAIEIESVQGIPRGNLISLLTPSILRKISGERLAESEDPALRD